jgi:hypothetical protein
MSNYIPRAAVARETWNQAKRRIYIEKCNGEAITLLKQRLKTEPTVIDDLLALGLTAKHAANLEGRLKYLNLQEEKLKGEKEPVVDPAAIQREAQSLEANSVNLKDLVGQDVVVNGQVAEITSVGGSNG